MRNWRTIAAAASLAALVGVSLLVPMGSVAQSGSTQLSDVLAQLRRNAKVSERLNAGFFRAPQTQTYIGSAFNPTDSDLAYTADRGDSSLSLDATRQRVTSTGGTVTVEDVPQTSGTFELPLEIQNRAQLARVTRSYRDVPGNNNGGAASGMAFSVVEYNLTGGEAKEIFAARSADGKTGTDTTQLPNGGYRVDNSRKRYALRVRFDETHADTRFYGFTIQIVIGRGVPGAPTS